LILTNCEHDKEFANEIQKEISPAIEIENIEKDDNEKNDLIQLKKETEHFKVYCSSHDIEHLDSLSNSLEKGYKKISIDLNHELSNKVSVYIYPDILKFHKTIDIPIEPSW